MRVSPAGLRISTRILNRAPARDIAGDVHPYAAGELRPYADTTALEQARSAGKFTPVHDAWWAQARKVHGERDGTRALIEVLLLNRHLAHEYVVAGLATALRAGALTADAVALEARKAAQAEDEPTVGASVPAPPGTPATVTSLHEWRLAHLPPDTRPLPSVTPYDQLLRRRRTSGSDHREGEAQ
ncbi:hypothetical protein OOK58_42425 [Streptomyces sp. NBC_01728]|uniref:hypothetical protein n=1 Tax=unclassified Streptomyces TaxID=2593676 RepID=UPI00225AFC44|nr:MULTISPECIES: hypothetical protein [unclassified Streptomyces]MCX4458570.1 hypothetical protein [Streptomyces sp. NBC_01719]MCX4497927.1 hypothetical protein [Streptomyces sp. NBC_01728]